MNCESCCVDDAATGLATVEDLALCASESCQRSLIVTNSSGLRVTSELTKTKSDTVIRPTACGDMGESQLAPSQDDTVRNAQANPKGLTQKLCGFSGSRTVRWPATWWLRARARSVSTSGPRFSSVNLVSLCFDTPWDHRTLCKHSDDANTHSYPSIAKILKAATRRSFK